MKKNDIKGAITILRGANNSIQFTKEVKVEGKIFKVEEQDLYLTITLAKVALEHRNIAKEIVALLKEDKNGQPNDSK